MHYIRFLRPPSIVHQGRSSTLSLVLTVVTDLGDAYLTLDKPLRLSARLSTQDSTTEPGITAELLWKPGDRVLKTSIPVPNKPWRSLLITPTADRLAATEAAGLISLGPEVQSAHATLLILPAWFKFLESNPETDVCMRKLHIAGDVSLQFEEEFGDSIARHVWDGGLAAVSFLSQPQILQNPTNSNPGMPIFRSILSQDQPLNILELGCGVGVLGVGMAAVLSLAKQDESVRDTRFLMTDVPEAEERARANLGIFQAAQEEIGRTVPRLEYENLDWQDGRVGKFSASIKSTPWDLVILSDCTYNTDTLLPLVETLSQLDKVVETAQKDSTGGLRVFIATKPRHDSEREVFDILGAHKWKVEEKAVIRLHDIREGEDVQNVELYLLCRER